MPITSNKPPKEVLSEWKDQLERYGKALEEKWLNTPGLWEGEDGDHIFDLPVSSGANDEGWNESEHERKSNGEFATGSVSLRNGQTTEEAQ